MLIKKTKMALCLSISLMAPIFAAADEHKKPVLISLFCNEASPTHVKDTEKTRQDWLDAATDSKSYATKQNYISMLMRQNLPWHEGTPACCLAAKRCVAERADMSWHKNCTMGDDWPIWFATVVNVPVIGCCGLAFENGCPIIAASIACCGLGIPCALKIFEQRQAKPENLRSTLDWLSSSSAWQERVATHAPRTMTMHLD